MQFEMEEPLKQKVLSLIGFKDSNEYCLLHKRNGDKCVVQIISVGMASISALDKKGKRFILTMPEIEKVEPIDQKNI